MCPGQTFWPVLVPQWDAACVCTPADLTEACANTQKKQQAEKINNEVLCLLAGFV